MIVSFSWSSPKTIAAWLTACLLLAALPATAQVLKFPEPEERSAEWELAFGGKIYDDWLAATYAGPRASLHPLMPAGVEIAPSVSWRCVTCHGYDYLGATLSRKGGPPVNMPGITGMGGIEPEAIAAYLRRPPHSYGPSLIANGALGLLARFVSKGQHELIDFLKFKNEQAVGKPIFQGVCISCHEADGRAFIEGEPGDKSSLGWLSRNRPAQVLHKIVNGQPGSDMVSLRFLGHYKTGALFAYLRTLPDPEPDPE
ncbi:hypothetical protein MNBD_ALPHA09-609 [hydrothermal vent metagenome]|uniref:Cytochrome c domain-containing protein n=1 Tax=hydrothermal vent metagenome TaxID=652676 RepID=A0A3B0TA12_9ZZZZ